jgi:hypothetical protein
MSKFKVGDKIRILSSAVLVGVTSKEIGTIQIITGLPDLETIIITSSGGGQWWVDPPDIEHGEEVGTQLVFDFMSE